ncbi:hypothetical protein F4779DRAFT_147522 [Xylariaceae sp. FL0662B]|nr:hypothetical protein F4779DRAFT_147522 [Xylariaceae sp. FL0662B]
MLTSDWQGSKLNPGAPAFTPRSAAAPNPLPASLIRNSWAEDAEEEASSPRKISVADSESASVSTAIRANATCNLIEPDNNSSPTIPHESIAQPAIFNISDTRTRRNTLQSVSCPEPTLLPFRGSPSRSVSHPAPIPPTNDQHSPARTCEPSPQLVSSQPPVESKPTSPVTRLPQQPSRGRGSFRGRSRGRYRGGRGRRRNTSQPKPT